ncbi:MAG: hypothetical protein KJ066_17220 [Acidobacteria bacterium]|nr:hypothetical protein [Acidobacteriota bacterium]
MPRTPTVAKSLSYGVRTAAAAPGLVLVLWCWSLVLGLAATAPVAPWWHRTIAWLPETDRLTDDIPWRVLAELVNYDRTPIGLIVIGAMAGLALVAIVGNSFLVGGAIAVLIGARQRLEEKGRSPDAPEGGPSGERPGATPVEGEPMSASGEAPEPPRPIVVPLLEDDSPLMHRFGRGAGRFFVRNLRLLLLHLVAAGAIVVAVAAVGVGITWPWRHSVHAIPALLAVAVPGVLALLGLAFFSIVLDYARIRLVAGDGRLMVSVWLGALRFVVRRFGGALGVWVSLTAVIVLATLLFGAYRQFVPAATWTQIVLLVVAQQAFMIVRSGLRIALLSAEIDYYTHRGRW